METEPIVVVPEGQELSTKTPPILKRFTETPLEREESSLDANDAESKNIGPAGRHFNAGVESLRRGEWAASIAEFTKAIDLLPTYSPAWNNRGVARELSGDEEGALGDILAALDASGDNSAAWNNRGLQLLRYRDFIGALQAFDEAILLSPLYARPRFHCGLVRSYQGDLAGAVKDFQEALRLDPTMEDAKRELEALLG
ncbi:MAG: tetratricopeptide repeat protein [Planctomycetota bacterium]